VHLNDTLRGSGHTGRETPRRARRRSSCRRAPTTPSFSGFRPPLEDAAPREDLDAARVAERRGQRAVVVDELLLVLEDLHAQDERDDEQDHDRRREGAERDGRVAPDGRIEVPEAERRGLQETPPSRFFGW